MSNPSQTDQGHKGWVRISHWIVTISFVLLAFTGFVILMAHPRLYWGNAGNDLTPALIELPISRNYRHGGWTASVNFFPDSKSVVSANRTYDIFNKNGWGRSLHFLAAWFFVVTGGLYLLIGIFSGHFRRDIWPRLRELSPTLLLRDMIEHARSRNSATSAGPPYNLVQKVSYFLVIFIALPVTVLTGLSMSPAITTAYPFLTRLFGFQSARTTHFLAFVILILFLLVHVAMVIKSGFKRQMRAMTIGK